MKGDDNNDNNYDNLDNNPLAFVSSVVLRLREYTVVGTFWFILIVLGSTYFHESRPLSVGAVLFIWVFIQISHSAVPFLEWKPTCKTCVKWTFYFIGYLVVGFLWSFAKLWIHIWRGHLEEDLLAVLLACQSGSETCYVDFSYLLQPRIFTWILYFPLSMAMTIFEDPIKIVLEVGHAIVERTYGFVIKHAITMYTNRHPGL